MNINSHNVRIIDNNFDKGDYKIKCYKITLLRRKLKNYLIYDELVMVFAIHYDHWWCKRCRLMGVIRCGIKVSRTVRSRAIKQHADTARHHKNLTSAQKRLNILRQMEEKGIYIYLYIHLSIIIILKIYRYIYNGFVIENLRWFRLWMLYLFKIRYVFMFDILFTF